MVLHSVVFCFNLSVMNKLFCKPIFIRSKHKTTDMDIKELFGSGEHLYCIANGRKSLYYVFYYAGIDPIRRHAYFRKENRV